jgi:3',5'-cyclic AMP phosphodiesterase CpdA
MATTLLCCGDIHLGRRPSRLPEGLAAHDVHPRSLTPAAAWRRLVDLALERRPAALVLAGDVVDSEAARYEAFGFLKRGVETLSEAGIQVVAVAGNHDVEALPRLAGMIQRFRLLGAGGRWESMTIEGPAGSPPVELLGWSFPGRGGAADPLAGLPPLEPPGERARIGVLHTELDGRDPRYAPTRQGDLAAIPVSAWLLGHVHLPTIDPEAPRPLGYLGSLVGLDPTETGARGAWELRAGSGAGLTMERLAIAPLRWEELEIDAEPIGDPATELFAAVERAVAARHEQIREELGEARAVGCRIRLTGRSAAGPACRQAAAALIEGQPMFPLGDTVHFVDRLAVEVRPAWDLERLARGSDPPALLARELLALERGDVDPELIENARKEIRRALSPAQDASLGVPAEPSDDEVVEQLRHAAREALDELLAQQEAEP